MSFVEIGKVRYFEFESLSEEKIVHAIFTRRGGVSRSPFASLNLGGTVGDDPLAVWENRQRAFSAIHLSVSSLYDVWQVHGNNVICTQAPRPLNESHRKADAIITDQSGVTLLMRFADCVPIMLFDPQRGVVGLVHAGWKGTVNKTVERAIVVMKEHYGSQPPNILAGIGPSIASHHYIIGAEVENAVRKAFGQDASALLNSANGNDSGTQFDLWLANRLLLENAGVRHIEIASICTACHLDDWYSHRAEDGKTGRFGALIGLQ